jgi:hypothetical protein
VNRHVTVERHDDILPITPMQPLVAVDWEKVDVVRVTLEAPYKGGGLRFRLGTGAAKKNATFNAQDPTSGPPYWPGSPLMYPEDAPAIAGDPERDSFTMTASLSAMMQTRNAESIGDPTRTAAFIAFGFFMAPLEVAKNGLIGFTQTTERIRIAAFWNWFKMPPDSKERLPSLQASNPAKIGPPAIPRVAIRPLTKNFMPLLVDGCEVVIRPFEFWKFDDPTMYHDWKPDELIAANADVNKMLEGFTSDEVEVLRGLVKAKVQSGKAKG